MELLHGKPALRIKRDNFPHNFPDIFYFGSATSAYQSEGATNEDGRGLSTWDAFTQRHSGMVKDYHNAYLANDSYHRCKEDVQIMKRMGLTAYKFSISWSRILPCGKLVGGVNAQGIKYYNDLINELKANDIEPFCTLFHWDLPQTLQDEYGGFLSADIIADFHDFAELCFWEFGDRVKKWITLHDPWSYCVEGYVKGHFPPNRGASSPSAISTLDSNNNDGDPGTEPYKVARNMLLAHANVYYLYKENFQDSQKGEIGIALQSWWMVPLDECKSDDTAAQQRALDFMLGWFMGPLVKGEYPKSMTDNVDSSRLVRFDAKEKKMLQFSYDFIGLNYYTARFVTSAKNCGTTSAKKSYSTDSRVDFSTKDKKGNDIGTKGASDWLYSYPKGIQKVLEYIHKEYKITAPIYITENGFDYEDNKPRGDDEEKIEYHKDHLLYLWNAMNDNKKMNVKGYFVRSLLDSFEWTDGYTVRFGFVHVDFKHGLTRFPKRSATWLMTFLSDTEK